MDEAKWERGKTGTDICLSLSLCAAAAQVSKSVDYVNSGTAALTTAKELQKKGRKLMCCSALILLVILFAILLGVTKPWESGSA